MLTRLRQFLDEQISLWAARQGAMRPAYTLEEPPAEIGADLACNAAMLMARALKMNPRQLAAELAALLNAAPQPYWKEVTVAGAGFLNFMLSPECLAGALRQVFGEGDAYGRLEQPPAERWLLEYVSANPTGPLHVGHGRGAAQGDSLARIFKQLGYPVTREYYINDAGNQVEMLGRSLLARVDELEGKPLALSENGYFGDYLKPVAEAFRNAPQPSGETERLAAATRFALDWLLAAIRRDLEAFGVTFDVWTSEAAFVAGGEVDRQMAALRARGHIKEEDGALWFVAQSDEAGEAVDKDRVLKRRDGRWTYFATDVAYHADKFRRGFERLMNLWGADHHGYVARVKGALEALGFDPSRLDVVLFQLVSLSRNGAPVAMSKRTGEFVTLNDLVREVGRDACRFFFALRSPNTAFDFDLELAKKQSNDNPVFYVQYAHARICSILRQAPSGANSGSADATLLSQKEERDLLKRLMGFPACLKTCAQERSPHPLATYLLQLARQFHYFYDRHRVLSEDAALTAARLALLRAVQQVLAKGLDLLGVSAPLEMRKSESATE